MITTSERLTAPKLTLKGGDTCSQRRKWRANAALLVDSDGVSKGLPTQPVKLATQFSCKNSSTLPRTAAVPSLTSPSFCPSPHHRRFAPILRVRRPHPVSLTSHHTYIGADPPPCVSQLLLPLHTPHSLNANKEPHNGCWNRPDHWVRHRNPPANIDKEIPPPPPSCPAPWSHESPPA